MRPVHAGGPSKLCNASTIAVASWIGSGPYSARTCSSGMRTPGGPSVSTASWIIRRAAHAFCMFSRQSASVSVIILSTPFLRDRRWGQRVLRYQLRRDGPGSQGAWGVGRGRSANPRRAGETRKPRPWPLFLA